MTSGMSLKTTIMVYVWLGIKLRHDFCYKIRKLIALLNLCYHNAYLLSFIRYNLNSGQSRVLRGN